MGSMTESNTETEFDLDMEIFRLLQDEPYFALLSRHINKVSTRELPTAGIRFNKEQARYELAYNPDFMGGKVPGMELDSKTGVKFVVMHELYHAALGHCTYRAKSNIPHKLQNIAQDLAINSFSHMREIAPDWCLMPGRAQMKFIGDNFERATEWYLKKIQDKIESDSDKHDQGDQGKPGDGSGGDLSQGQFDSHDDFGGSDGASDSLDDCPERVIADKRLAEAAEKAANEAELGDGNGGQPKGWGSVSSKTREAIKKFAGSGKQGLDPKKVLTSFIKASVAASKKTSVTKRNRRLPGMKFGKKTSHTANIAFSIDQSGSVSNELLEKVFAWLNEFTKFATITVVPFDHQVFEDKVYVWEKGQKRKAERVLCGGTDFDAPTDYVNKRRFDGHIIITDMWAPRPKRSNCQRMWITDTYGASNPSCAGTERVLVLK